MRLLVVPRELSVFTVAGYFKTGYYEFDTKLILTSLPVAQQLYGIDDIVWGIGVKIKDIFKMDRISIELQDSLGYEFQTFTAEDRNQNLFYALQIERFVMTVILFLVIISAGFTIMGTLVMVVMEKREGHWNSEVVGGKPGVHYDNFCSGRIPYWCYRYCFRNGAWNSHRHKS
jgi:ABC-type lipoprotein release transport system permease subunit